MAMGAEVEVAPGLFYVYCGSGPLEANEVAVDDLNWHLQGCPFRENLPVGQIWMVVGLTDSCMDTLGPFAIIWHLAMAQAVSHQPSWIVKGSAAR